MQPRGGRYGWRHRPAVLAGSAAGRLEPPRRPLNLDARSGTRVLVDLDSDQQG